MPQLPQAQLQLVGSRSLTGAGREPPASGARSLSRQSTREVLALVSEAVRFTVAELLCFAFMCSVTFGCAGLHRSDLSLRNTGSIAHRLRSYGLWSTGLGAVGHGLSWASPGAQTVRKLPAVREIRIQPVSQEGPLEEGMANHCSVLTWRIPWAGEPGYSPRDYKESDMTE